MDAGTQWRGQADTTKRRLIVWLGVSFLLHTPLTPLAALLSLLGLLSQGPDGPEPVFEPMTEIPIDLIESEEPSEGKQEPAEAPKPVAAPPPEPEAVVVTPKPARVEDAGAAPVDAGVEEAGVAAAGPDAGDDGGGPAAGQGIGDPLAVAAGTKRIVDANANVKLTIYTERIRDQPLGARVGPLLRSVYQWRDFFGPTQIDPIRDIDQLVVVGPQLRDSSAVTAILRHHVEPEKMRGAIDALASRDPEGGWLDAGVPAASARVDRAERRIVMTAPDTVVVTPPETYESVVRNAKSIRLKASAGSEVLTAHVTTPSRVLIGVRSPVKIPESIKWARAKVTPTPQGGAFVEIEAQDESPEMARANAQYLTRAINAVTTIDIFISRVTLLEPVSFHAQGDKIYGTATATRQQLETVLGFVESFLAQQQSRRAPPRPLALPSGSPPPVPAPSGSPPP